MRRETPFFAVRPETVPAWEDYRGRDEVGVRLRGPTGVFTARTIYVNRDLIAQRRHGRANLGRSGLPTRTPDRR